MRVAGVICEYNPLHLGHAWMMTEVRRQGADAIVCAMSGNFVQRGEAAIADKLSRAEMAVRCGADLVLELPTPWAAATAEIFARGGVMLLEKTGVVTDLALAVNAVTHRRCSAWQRYWIPMNTRRICAPFWQAARCLLSADKRLRLRWQGRRRPCCSGTPTII